MKKVILCIMLVFAVSVTFNACKTENKEVKKEVSSDKKEDIKYQCPMKCEKEKTYDKEGKCPVCEMKLRRKV